MMKTLTDKKWGAFYISDEKENAKFMKNVATR